MLGVGAVILFVVVRGGSGGGTTVVQSGPSDAQIAANAAAYAQDTSLAIANTQSSAQLAIANVNSQRDVALATLNQTVALAGIAGKEDVDLATIAGNVQMADFARQVNMAGLASQVAMGAQQADAYKTLVTEQNATNRAQIASIQATSSVNAMRDIEIARINAPRDIAIANIAGETQQMTAFYNKEAVQAMTGAGIGKDIGQIAGGVGSLLMSIF